jgi:hypothetical protein
MFAGLTSPCTMPASCTAISPVPAAMNADSTSRHPGFTSSIQRRRLRPTTSSIARNTCPRSSTASYTATTFGCAMRAIARASASSTAGSVRALRIALIATARSRRTSRAM